MAIIYPQQIYYLPGCPGCAEPVCCRRAKRSAVGSSSGRLGSSNGVHQDRDTPHWEVSRNVISSRPAFDDPFWNPCPAMEVFILNIDLYLGYTSGNTATGNSKYQYHESAQHMPCFTGSVAMLVHLSRARSPLLRLSEVSPLIH